MFYSLNILSKYKKRDLAICERKCLYVFNFNFLCILLTGIHQVFFSLKWLDQQISVPYLTSLRNRMLYIIV